VVWRAKRNHRRQSAPRNFTAKYLYETDWYLHMKLKTACSNKLTPLFLVVFVAMVAFSQNASAARHPLPPESSVPDGGTTIMLLGVALGALGLARGFLKR
jgi:uncharacterized membrane protein YadS